MPIIYSIDRFKFITRSLTLRLVLKLSPFLPKGRSTAS
jgi:hypothetical protein